MDQGQTAPARRDAAPVRWKCAVRAGAPALVVSVAATAWCAVVVGPNLGLFLGTLLLATCYTPALVLSVRFWGNWIALAAIILGTSATMGIAALSMDVTFGEWLRCTLVLATYAWALAGLSLVLVRLGISRSFVSLAVVLLGLLWLTWGVWLSPWMTQGMADWFSPANPLFAMNSLLRHLGTWDHAPIAYRSLTVLDQDVPYRLPGTIAFAVLFHAVIGAPGMLLALRRPGTQPTEISSSPAAPTPSAGR